MGYVDTNKRPSVIILLTCDSDLFFRDCVLNCMNHMESKPFMSDFDPFKCDFHLVHLLYFRFTSFFARLVFYCEVGRMTFEVVQGLARDKMIFQLVLSNTGRRNSCKNSSIKNNAITSMLSNLEVTIRVHTIILISCTFTVRD